MKYILECLYCGFIWRLEFFYPDNLQYIKCEKCSSKQIKVKEYKTYGY